MSVMERASVLAIAVLACVASPLAAFELPPCDEAYARGVSHFQMAEFVDAERYFENAISLTEEPDADGAGYTPYLYLAATRFELGDALGAQAALEQSEAYGVAGETVSGRQLMNYYAADIRDGKVPAASELPQSSVALTSDSALTELQSQLIRSKVLKRCALSDDLSDNKLPWYFHYLLGDEYAEAGDNARALESYQMGANLKEGSSRHKRLYGMWFMEYLPYYKIAVTNAEMGKWEEAREALNVSLAQGEFEENGAGWDTYLEMERLIDSKLSS